MTITASTIKSNVIIQFSNETGLPDFVGFQLERKNINGNWQSWDGSGWGAIPAPLTTTNFTDYNIPNGIYQYRVRIQFTDILGDYAYTSWVKIGLGNTGWTFGNYSVPEGAWGDVLTTDDMRKTYLWGITFKGSDGADYTDAQVQFSIDSALAEIERALNLTIRKRKIVCDSDDNSAIEYDEAESPYPFRHDRWGNSGLVPLRRRPVISVDKFELWSIVDQKVLNLHPWMRLNRDKGHLHFFPKVGPSGLINVNPIAALGNGYMGRGDYQHGFRVAYTAGMQDASKVPADLRDVIGKVAACKLLNIIGDGLIAGFSSSSLSLDGVSESFSSTQSAENAYFSARIKQYLKDVEDYLKVNAKKFKSYVIGSI